MSSSDQLATNMRATTEAFVHAFDGQWTVEAAMAPRAPECEHTILPSSLGMPRRNNDEWAANFSRIAGLVREAKVHVSI